MVLEISLTKECYRITEGRTEGRTDGRTDRCKPVYPPLFQSGDINTSLSSCIQNMTTPACTVSLKSLRNFNIESMERKKIGQIQGIINMRRLVRSPTIQYIIINLHTKYGYSSLHGFKENFDEKIHYSKCGKEDN